ncbi:MAG: hypothetical protein ACFCVC_18620, partial [Acidimicrobiia bacterium]
MRMAKVSLATLVAVAAVLAGTASTAHAQSSQIGDFRSAPCPFEGLELGPVTLIPEDDGFECGYVTVPERHADPDGATI